MKILKQAIHDFFLLELSYEKTYKVVLKDVESLSISLSGVSFRLLTAIHKRAKNHNPVVVSDYPDERFILRTSLGKQ